jgi:hypothetical protein
MGTVGTYDVRTNPVQHSHQVMTYSNDPNGQRPQSSVTAATNDSEVDISISGKLLFQIEFVF